MTTRFLLALGLILGALGTPADAVVCTPATYRRAAWWSAEGSPSDTFGCYSGVVVNGASYSAGRIGQAFQFDGVNDYVAVPDDGLWTLGDAQFAISLWANFDRVPASTISGPCCVFIGASEGGGAVDKWAFLYGGGVLAFHINSPQAGSFFLAKAPFTPQIGTWYHLLVTRTTGQQGNIFQIYLNGSLVSAELSNVAVPDPDVSLTIGQVEGLGYFPGLLDEIQLVRVG